MEHTPQEQIDSILRSLEAKGVPAALVLEANALAASHSEAVGDLAIAVMRRFPKGGTFLDGALSFLPQEAWPELVQFALGTLERSGGKNAAAESIIEYASLQCLSALHPHLDRIFVTRPNAGSYIETYPWRESGRPASRLPAHHHPKQDFKRRGTNKGLDGLVRDTSRRGHRVCPLVRRSSFTC